VTRLLNFIAEKVNRGPQGKAPPIRKKPDPKNVFNNPFLQPGNTAGDENVQNSAISFGADESEDMFVSDPIPGA
jgi:hypothetical protein